MVYAWGAILIGRCSDDRLPRDPRVQDVRTQIGTCRPDDRAQVGLDPHLRELDLIAQRRKHAAERDQLAEIQFTGGPVRELEMS